MEPYIGQILCFAGNFAPRGFLPCDGRLLSIAQNTALFSLLGTTYGGDGKVTFGLPNLNSRTPIGFNSSGGSPDIGETGGQQSVTLTIANVPSGAGPQLLAATGAATETNPSNGVLASAQIYTAPPASVPLSSSALQGGIGGSQPLSVQQPYLGITFCIATEGVYPSRS